VFRRTRGRFGSPLVDERDLQLAGDDAWQPQLDRVISLGEAVLGFSSMLL
jgi:hypothetical protein